MVEEDFAEDPDKAGWTKGQWRAFMVVFGVLFLLANGIFWYQLMRLEISTRRLETLIAQFDREWAYLQRLSRLQRIEQGRNAAEKEDRAVFRGERTGLSFAYPSSWGEFVESEPRTFYAKVHFRRGSQARIAGLFRETPPTDFVSGWDIIAGSVRSGADIDGICATQTLADTCLTITAPTGVRYARIRYENYLEIGQAFKGVVIYILAHPESAYSGIAMSNIELRRLDIPHTVSDMDAIVDTVVLER